MKDRDTEGSAVTALMSIPSYNRMKSNFESFNDTAWKKLVIRLKEPDNQEHIKEVITTIQKYLT